MVQHTIIGHTSRVLYASAMLGVNTARFRRSRAMAWIAVALSSIPQSKSWEIREVEVSGYRQTAEKSCLFKYIHKGVFSRCEIRFASVQPYSPPTALHPVSAHAR
jgi:hypothetical protein